MYKALFWLLLVIPIIPAEAGKEGASESTVKSFKDYVKIRHMPSRSEFIKNEPVTEFRGDAITTVVAKTGKVMGTNITVRDLHQKAKALADKGITSNQRFFHVSFTTIEISYMGNKVSLDYVGKSGDQKYEQYEKDWQRLYKEVHSFLSGQIAPDNK